MVTLKIYCSIVSSEPHTSHLFQFIIDMSQSHFSQGWNLCIIRYWSACSWVSLLLTYGSLRMSFQSRDESYIFSHFYRTNGFSYLKLIKQLHMGFIKALCMSIVRSLHVILRQFVSDIIVSWFACRYFSISFNQLPGMALVIV